MSHQSDTVGRVAVGLLLVLLGGLFLAGNLDAIDIGPIGRYWPVILIVIGAVKLAGRERPCGGAWLLVAGVVMLLHTLRLLSLHDSWPLFIVAAGLGILVRSVAPGLCEPGAPAEK